MEVLWREWWLGLSEGEAGDGRERLIIFLALSLTPLYWIYLSALDSSLFGPVYFWIKLIILKNSSFFSKGETTKLEVT